LAYSSFQYAWMLLTKPTIRQSARAFAWSPFLHSCVACEPIGPFAAPPPDGARSAGLPPSSR
jgi:hypothetical protein